MGKYYFKKGLIIVITLLCVELFFQPVTGNIEDSIKNNSNNVPIKKIYRVLTKDLNFITLTRYIGNKRPSIMMIHGFTGNHHGFDWDKNHSLAQFLNNDGWDVWMLDLRTHDGDGDFWFDKKSDREYICRFWDFDRTYLRKDVVTAVEFIKEKSDHDKIFFLGHSMGGYLCYAYAELIRQDDMAGIIAIGASGMANTWFLSNIYMMKYGIKIGKKVLINPFGRNRLHFSKWKIMQQKIPQEDIFFDFTTPRYIQEEFYYRSDDEPAGVCVDMFFGRDPRFYNGHWVDPQTLHDYTDKLSDITVPFLAIAGDKDLVQDPPNDMLKTFQNISSKKKEFHIYADYSHCDLLLGDNASTLIFPDIINWLNSLI